MQRASLNMNNDLKFNIVWIVDNSLKNINKLVVRDLFWNASYIFIYKCVKLSY